MVHALPLRLRNETVGAMNILSAELRTLSPLEVDLAQALADAATIGILQERAVRRGVQLAEQLQGALESRIVVEQAKGIVAERLQVGMEEAFALIRRYARSERRRLSEVAVDLISGGLQVSDLGSSLLTHSRILEE